MRLRSLSKPGVLMVVVAVVAMAAASASAGNSWSVGGRYASTSDCPVYTQTQPFLPWSDLGYYFLAPGGNFENTLTGWTSKSGAKIVSGNESYYVGSAKDSHSLSLPNGSSVTSPSICVTADTPDIRLFVLNTGSTVSGLNVNMTYTNQKGKPATATVAKLTGSPSWALTGPIPILQNIQPLLDGTGATWVTFTFTPADSKGKWQVDDFYVDPLKHH